jgi:hypothetical protein
MNPHQMLFQWWTGRFFIETSLQSLGLKVQLGHANCPCPAAVIPDFVVVDMSGQHTINLSFCECVGAPHRRVQLLHASWFPTSFERPRTAFTFDILNLFQLITLQGKLSAYNYYYSLVHKTDKLGVTNVKVCDLIYY